MTIAIITEAGVRKVAPLVVVAQQAAASANLSAQVAIAIQDGRVYPDYATGNAATIAGQYFIVAASGSLALHIHGTATALVKLPIIDVASGNLLLASGRIGVGTATPAVPIHTKGAAEIQRLETTTGRGNGNAFWTIHDPSGQKLVFGYGSAFNDQVYLLNRMNAAILFGTNDLDRFQITASGNFEPIGDNAKDAGSLSARLANTFSVNFRPGAGTAIWTSGTGTPEGAVTAPVGSLFTRTDGGANTTLYVKQSGSGNTGWAAK